MIEILCDDSTSCKEACDNNDYHRSRQRQTFNMSVKSMRNSLDHFIYRIFLYKCKLSFRFVALYSALYAQYYRNVSKRSLITSVRTIHGLDNQK